MESPKILFPKVIRVITTSIYYLQPSTLLQEKLHTMEPLIFFLRLILLTVCTVLRSAHTNGLKSTSIIGDPGMKRDELRVAFEAWNFCNEVGTEAPAMGSPRLADCFDFSGNSLIHRVDEKNNKLGVGKPFPGLSSRALQNPDLYAVEKELYLGSLCQVPEIPNPWQFWMVMLKNGNFDTRSGLCPENGKKVGPFIQSGKRFPCFGNGCMNQPSVFHQQTRVSASGEMVGGFNGSYDFDLKFGDKIHDSSYFEVIWRKTRGNGSWVFSHKLRTSNNYPWLMLYLRADATTGFSGGYHYQTRGMLKTLPESPNFKVKLTLTIKQGGGPKSQFYLIDIGGCWKNNGAECDGDTTTDVTRYSEMIINPKTPAWCSPSNLNACPPFHITPENHKIFRNNTADFPYTAYHYYCSPANALFLEDPHSTCDPYSNPQPQEIVQLLPHPAWASYGFPARAGEGWIGDPRTWELDVGGLSGRLYFYQDPGSSPAKRIWRSVDVGTEIFVSDGEEIAEWSVGDFDVTVSS